MIDTNPHRDLPLVAHSVYPYLPKSGSWIYSQLTGLRGYRTLVITKRLENREHFPHPDIHSRCGLSPLSRAYQRLRRRFGRTYFPFHRAILQQRGARILHSHFGDLCCWDTQLKEDLDIPQVCSFYGADVWKLSRNPDWCERYRNLFRVADRFLVEGPAMRVKVLEMGCPPEKVRLHHIGVDLGKINFMPRRPTDGAVRFLVSGRIVEKKGHDLAIRAFAKVHRDHPRTHLGMMLIRPERRVAEVLDPLRHLIAEEGLEDAVTIHDYLPYAEYLAALASYHVFLAPSVHAKDGDAEGGFPVTITEMLASGMPIVGSDHCDIPEIVRDGETGRLVPEGDVDALATAMNDLRADPDAWEGMARRGRQLIEDEYDIAAQTAGLERVYDELLEG